MKPRVRMFSGVVVAGCLAWGVRAQEPARGERAGVVVITLTARVVAVAEPLVRLGDVADIRGGTEALRDRIAGLDLAVLDVARPDVSVSKDQISFRLQLAGWETRQFWIAGPARAAVKLNPGAAAISPRSGFADGAVAQASFRDGPAVLKMRDPVRLVVRLGSVRVTARGEAQEDGRLGQMIRVRNVDSNKIVTGRVAERNVVEVDY